MHLNDIVWRVVIKVDGVISRCWLLIISYTKGIHIALHVNILPVSILSILVIQTLGIRYKSAIHPDINNSVLNNWANIVAIMLLIRVCKVTKLEEDGVLFDCCFPALIFCVVFSYVLLWIISFILIQMIRHCHNRRILITLNVDLKWHCCYCLPFICALNT
jgi:hypothetical protein